MALASVLVLAHGPANLNPDNTMFIEREVAISEMRHVGSVFYRQGWMLGTAGNLSVRVESEPLRYLVTASGGHKGELGPSDFICFGLGMSEPDSTRKASAETCVHDALYAKFAPGSILHIHGPYCTLLSRRYAEYGFVDVSGWEYVKGLGFWDEGAVVRVPIVPNHHDLNELAAAVARRAAHVPGVLVDGHGLYAWGRDMDEARRHVECFEALARLAWESR